MTDVPSTIEALNELIGIDWSDIAKRDAREGDQTLGFDESGNWIRISSNLVDAVVNDLVDDVANFQSLLGLPVNSELFPAFPGNILSPNKTLYQLLTELEAAIEATSGGGAASGQEAAAISGGQATLTTTPNGSAVGITHDGTPIREGTHFTRDGRTITITEAGDPAQPLAEDGAATWLYPVDGDPDRKFEATLIISGSSTLNNVPQSVVVGFTGDNRVLRQDSHFTVDEAGVITISTHGDPAQPHAEDGDVTWIYSTSAAAASSPEENRGAFEFDNTDGTAIDSDATIVAIITDDNENDTFTITGNCSMLIVKNERDDIKTIAGAEVGGQTVATLAKISGVWRTL